MTLIVNHNDAITQLHNDLKTKGEHINTLEQSKSVCEAENNKLKGDLVEKTHAHEELEKQHNQKVQDYDHLSAQHE